MHIIVAYDIPNDKRRERLRKALLRFGNSVQKSVVECDLSARQIETMTRVIRQVMSEDEDNVRCYQICKGCSSCVEVFGGKPLTRTNGFYVV